MFGIVLSFKKFNLAVCVRGGARFSQCQVCKGPPLRFGMKNAYDTTSTIVLPSSRENGVETYLFDDCQVCCATTKFALVLAFLISTK